MLCSVNLGARKSPLSQKQVQEVQSLLPDVAFTVHLFDTQGDLDLQTPLSTLGKTDFFTKEIDEALLTQKIRLAVHSAKDLPDPIPDGLQVVAITKGLDPSDVLVMRDEDTFRPGMRIGVSSERRKEMVPDCSYIEIRGTIHGRLEQLDQGLVDGVVMAKAALIRLNLLHRNFITLQGKTAPYQGKLAILARKGDQEMRKLFFPLDSRKKILSTSILGEKENLEERIDPFVLLDIEPRSKTISWQEFTHVIVTSPSAAKILGKVPLDKTYIVTGEKTKETLGVPTALCARPECQEGICELLQALDLQDANLLYLCSNLARSLIKDFLEEKKIRHTIIELYETKAKTAKPLADISAYEEIRFSSPSSVKAFISLYGSLPQGVSLKAKGHITQKELP